MNSTEQAGPCGSPLTEGLGLVAEADIQALLTEFGWRPQDIGDYTSRKQVAFARRVVKLAREAAIKACQGEQLEDEPDTEGDFAYMHAVCDCIAAIRKA